MPTQTLTITHPLEPLDATEIALGGKVAKSASEFSPNGPDHQHHFKRATEPTDQFMVSGRRI
jgi:hypothetical protein